MAEISQELVILSQEASRLREEFSGQRIRWPEEFRQKVLALWSGGVRRQEIVQATGVSPYSLYDWRRKRSGGDSSDFTELKLVSFRRRSSPLLIRTRHGSEIEGLGLSDLRLFLREGLL